MPITVHELLIRDVVSEIWAQLSSIGAGQSSSANFARHIIDWRRTDIEPLNLDYGKHSPDTSFGQDACPIPRVILEVSYSQKQKDLSRLAGEYLLGSNGNIQVVVGLDLPYKGSEATISMWKLATTVKLDGSLCLKVELVIKKKFRGQMVNDSAGLRISLADFANSSVRALYQEPITGDVFISASQLCAFLINAEDRYSFMKSSTDHVMALPLG